MLVSQKLLPIQGMCHNVNRYQSCAIHYFLNTRNPNKVGGLLFAHNGFKVVYILSMAFVNSYVFIELLIRAK